MKNVILNLLILSMSVTYFLLAVQAEIVTKIFGFIFGSVMALSLIAQVIKQAKTDA